MKVLLGVIALGICLQNIQVEAAGRAIPVNSENYVLDLFRKYNRGIQYDSTNFLVDLAGNYAGCEFANTRGLSAISDKTPEGGSIGLIQDFTYGDETHVNAVERYLVTVFDRWVNDRDFRGQIENAVKFGCSVRPGCRGIVSVACLFSPAYKKGNPQTLPPFTQPRTTRRPTTKSPTPPPTTPRPNPPNPVFPQKAKAFTEQQYDMAEAMTEQKWDRSYFLENLSGYETKCTMMANPRQNFEKAKLIAREYGKDVTGLFGYARNIDSTPNALAEILQQMKLEALSDRVLSGYFTNQGNKGKKVGCSLIPDCINPNTRVMFVVVSCIFEL